MLDTSIVQLWRPLRLLLRYDGDIGLKTQPSTQHICDRIGVTMS
jgi:hypothetical protein